ncbi:MAG: cytochrome P460 family protein [Acidobacteriaceae bacterium]|nr:cytochrome P460 family protein [Acidobacteriaceae bacterium]
MRKIRRAALAVVAFVGLVTLLVDARQADSPASDGPQFTSDHRMLRPQHYREWIYLSSGLGMSYSPPASGDEKPPFDNVFVNPSAYRSFVATGTWPDRTVFILEIRTAQSKGSINQAGRFQGALEDVEVHVKDSRLPGKWAFFAFPASAQSAPAIPEQASCYSCHQQHGAVDTTFVQFYPTLLEIAKSKGTLKQSY